MSLSWPERVELDLYPDRVMLWRGKGAQMLSVAPKQPDAPPWRAALATLAALDRVSKAQVTVVLSSFFVRYTLVPLSATLTSAAERLALARHCLVRIHGAAAEQWTVRLSGEVACGVDAALVEELRAALAARANRLRSLQPRLMASFNRCRRRLGESGWFVDVEPGLASLGLVANGAWQSLRCVKIGPRWEEELPGLVEREACFVDTPPNCSQVVRAFP